MKTETKARIWDEVVTQLNLGLAKGKSFDLRFVPESRMITVKIFNNQLWTMPPKIAARLTGDAKAFVECEREKAEARTREWCEQQRRLREALDARLGEDGFSLIAGEETELVCSGTLRHCRANLYKVRDYPRCSYAHKGCYLITDCNGVEVQAGEFDKDCVY